MFEATRKMFTNAAKSFVILHHIDYKKAFACKCPVRPFFGLFACVIVGMLIIPCPSVLLLTAGTRLFTATAGRNPTSDPTRRNLFVYAETPISCVSTSSLER